MNAQKVPAKEICLMITVATRSSRERLKFAHFIFSIALATVFVKILVFSKVNEVNPFLLQDRGDIYEYNS